MDTNFGGGDNATAVKCLQETSGGWLGLLHRAGEKHHSGLVATEFVSGDPTLDPEFKSLLGIPQNTTFVLKIMSELGEPVDPEGISMLADDGLVTEADAKLALDWAERIHYAQRVAGGLWQLDPVVQRMVARM